MKLKYMLRGIGLGAILMAAIMYFVYGKSNKALSDDEIKSVIEKFFAYRFDCEFQEVQE